MDGVTTTVKVAHVRLYRSRMMLVRAYPRETQEMVFDAHERAFAFFRGACSRGIYDNMKTAVETILIGKNRQYNRRFLQMCSHHLVEPVACTPASGWEKGQVENQVGLVRERFFTPRLRVKSYDELNACSWTSALPGLRRMHIRNFRRRTIWEVFEEERPKLIPYRGRFDGFHALPASVSKTCLVRFKQQILGQRQRRWSAGRHPRLCRSHCDPPGRADFGEHRRSSSGRGETVYDPWHYVPVLARKPGALARRAVQGLGAADGAGPRAAQAGRVRRRRPADGENPRRRAHRWIGRSRRGVSPGAVGGRPFR